MKIRKSLITLLSIISFVGIGFVQGSIVHADDNPGEFSVKAIIPDNQVDQNVTYFDLLVTPNQEETIEFEVQNLANKDRTFDINVNPAITSDGGTIDYSQSNAKLDKTIPLDVRKYLKLDQTKVNIKANSTVRIPIKMSLPSKQFDGRVLAGVNVAPEDNESSSSSSLNKSNTGTTIENRLAYTLAIVLQQNTNKVDPKLNLVSASGKAYNSKPYVTMNFQNPSGTIINNLKFSTKLYKDGKLYIKNDSNPFLVAPNTNFNLRLDLNGHTLEAGKYSAEVTAKDSEHTWKFKKSFTISDSQAKDVNQNTVYDTNSNRWWIWLIVIIVVGAAGAGIYIFMKRRKK